MIFTSFAAFPGLLKPFLCLCAPNFTSRQTVRDSVAWLCRGNRWDFPCFRVYFTGRFKFLAFRVLSACVRFGKFVLRGLFWMRGGFLVLRFPRIVSGSFSVSCVVAL
jgi:hypothetical protein